MIEPAKPQTQPPALAPASAEFVEASLGYLALGVGRPELARQHAQKAVDLDRSAPDGHAILAYLALGIDGTQTDLAVTHAQAALDRGSRDSEMFVLLGDSYENGPNGMKPDAKRIRVGMYENAINLSPRQISYYDRLAEALCALEHPREDDAKFLSFGMRAFPGDDWLRVGSAALDAALRPDSRLDAQQRNYAAGMRSHWLLQTMQAEISTAVSNRDFTGARGIVSRYRGLVDKSPLTDSVLLDTDERLESYRKS
jgi:tetratricopeptide (TPR) repeat protein